MIEKVSLIRNLNKNTLQCIAVAAVMILISSEAFALCAEPVAEYVRIKLGEHVFKAPMKPSFLFIGRGEASVSSECFKDYDPPIDADRFSFLADLQNGTIFSKYVNKELEEKTRNHFTLVVGVVLPKPIVIASDTEKKRKWRESPDFGGASKPYGTSPHYVAEDMYERFVLPAIKNGSLKLASLPKKNGFYVWEGMGGIEYKYYISADKKFVTPRGNPVTFACDAWGGYKCGTSIAWKDGIQFGFSDLKEMYVPSSKLKEFYYDFFAYMKNLEVQPVAK